MGRLSKKKHRAIARARAASAARKTHGTKRGRSSSEGLDGKCWLEMPPPKRHTSTEPEAECPGCAEPLFQARCNRATGAHSEPTEVRTAGRLAEAVQVLARVGKEREELLRKQHRITKGDMRGIAAKYSISVATLYRWRNKAPKGTLFRGGRSGRPLVVSAESRRGADCCVHQATPRIRHNQADRT